MKFVKYSYSSKEKISYINFDYIYIKKIRQKTVDFCNKKIQSKQKIIQMYSSSVHTRRTMQKQYNPSHKTNNRIFS